MKLLVFFVALFASVSAFAEDFFAQMVLQGVTFQVESPNDSSINPVTVRAETSDGPIASIDTEADGAITDLEVADWLLRKDQVVEY